MEETILDDPTLITGVIYLIEHVASGKRYVGQTLSHRKNKGRYRPFGAIGRFRDHISEAINNTKRKQCTYLNNAIRLYGAEAFTVRVIAECEKADLDTLECSYINEYSTMFPTGYNLTKGGKGARATTLVDNETSLNAPRKRGGCSYRSAATRQKMSDRAKEKGITEADRTRCMTNAISLHSRNRMLRFKDVVVDLAKIEDYISVNGTTVIVTIGKLSTGFASKYETEDIKRERAKEFIVSLSQQATLPN